MKKQDQRKPLGVIARCALFAVFLTGCASTGQIADQIVKSNLAQESAQNQLLLLNIVRAYQRRPMHFTQISAIRLPVGVGNPSFTIPTPFGPDFTQQVYNVSTSVAITQGVDTTVLNSQEFMRGITTPMPPSLMLYYLEQGWPQQMILLLFVRKIEVYQGKKLIQEYTNYPESQREFSKFSAALSELRGCEFEAAPLDGKAYGPEYNPGQLLDIRGLAAAKSADLALEPRGTDPKRPTAYQFVKQSKSMQLVQSDGSSKPCTLPDGARALKATSSPEREKGDQDNGVTATFVLRSPEAMIYYLGEIARAQLEGQTLDNGERVPVSKDFPTFKYGAVREQTFPGAAPTLFTLNKGSASDSAVSVDYEGAAYSLPRGSNANRTMHVLSLLTQVIGLQNKGADLPSTANVRIVP